MIMAKAKKTEKAPAAETTPAGDPELIARGRELEAAEETEAQALLKKKNSGRDEPVECPLSSERIKVPEFPVAWRRLILKGITPLLTNAVSKRVLDQIARDQSGAKKEKQPRVPVQEYFEHHHFAFGKAEIKPKDDLEEKIKEYVANNLAGFPGVGIKKALCQTIGLIFGKEVKAQLSHWIWINGPYSGLVPILGEPIEDATHENFMNARKPSVLRRDPTFLWSPGKGKVLTPCYRPMFFPWYMTVDVRINPSVLLDEDLLRAFTALGTLTTFGSYRVSRGGDFGQFKVEKVIALKPDYQPAANWGSNV